MLNSKELEKQLLSCLMQYPSSYGDIAGLIDESDFYVQNGSFVHRTIFRVIKNILSNANAEALDDVVIIERLKSANISFVDNIDVGDYVRSLLLKKVSSKAAIGVAKELKNLSAKEVLKKFAKKYPLRLKVMQSLI